MPFGKKKDDKKSKEQEAVSAGSYPRQQPYPVQASAVPPQCPPYTPQGAQSQVYPTTAPPPYGAVPPNPQTAPNVQVCYPPHVAAAAQSILIHNGFDSGARFNVCPPSIPPPPPGAMVHPAQMAAAAGVTVQMTQRQTDYFTGGSDGGYTFF